MSKAASNTIYNCIIDTMQKFTLNPLMPGGNEKVTYT